MKPTFVSLSLAILLCASSAWIETSTAAEKPKGEPAQKAERLRQLDADGDGKLAKEEMSKALWDRISPYDLDGDGKLDAAEQASAGLGAAEGKDGKNPGGAPSSFTVGSFTGGNGQTLRYSLYVPESRKADEKLPVVLCLHGRGGGTDAPLALSQPEMRTKFPCLIIAPGIDGAKERWAPSSRDGKQHRVVLPELMEALDTVIEKHHGDPDRVYVTGQSMGGVGTWGLIATHPERFAAAVPVCGFWPIEDATKMKAVPVWAFHGADDSTVPVAGSRDMIAALKAAGAEPKYTEFPGVGHGSWAPAYATAELWEWLFAQKRGGR